jgi:hypothetical protein
MRGMAALFVMVCSATLNANERMAVTICDLAGLPHYLIKDAERELSFVFKSMDIDVQFPGCEVVSEDREAWFVIRLRKDGAPYYANELSLHTMGRAFVSGSGKGYEGYIADIYSPAVKAMSQQTGTDEGRLLGWTIAHELGHLLLGPGHSLTGIMTGQWGDKEMAAIAKRWLGFHEEERSRIRERLREITQGPRIGGQGSGSGGAPTGAR